MQQLLFNLILGLAVSSCLGGRETKTIEVDDGEKTTNESGEQGGQGSGNAEGEGAGGDAASESGLVFPAGFTAEDQKHGEDLVNGWKGHNDAKDPQGDWSVQTVSTAVRVGTKTRDPQPTPDPAFTQQNNNPNEVVFEIQPGTGGGAWNSPNNPIVARAGQTLIIRNLDSVPHLPHTNDEPFDHPDPSNPIPPQGERRFQLDMPFQGTLYDHVHGPGASVFWSVSP